MFNKEFSTTKQPTINSIKKHENLNKQIETNTLEFTTQKTLQLFKKRLTPKQIAGKRNIKEGTVWKHLSKLVEFHQLQLKEILPNKKIKKILSSIRTANDTLKNIKERVKDDTINYNEISCVLANIQGKQRKKSITYFINWYKKTNCQRKCYYDKTQREMCRAKFQQLISKCNHIEFTKKEFLLFINKTTICALPEKQRIRHVSWQEFKKKK
jgi:hypothetical protein